MAIGRNTPVRLTPGTHNGGKRIMLASSVLLAAGAAAMPFARDFWTLFAAQSILVLARATFWPANWSITADLPGERGVQAGRLNAVTNLGQILGNGSCGFILALGGFDVSFAVLAALGLGALALGTGTPLVMGSLADRFGIAAGFYVLGGLSLGVVVFIAALRRRAFARTKLAA